jgi:hypothetical protein
MTHFRLLHTKGVLCVAHMTTVLQSIREKDLCLVEKASITTVPTYVAYNSYVPSKGVQQY